MENKTEEQKDQITRKQALKKMGFGALTAGTMMIVLNKPQKAVAASGAADDPGQGF